MGRRSIDRKGGQLIVLYSAQTITDGSLGDLIVIRKLTPRKALRLVEIGAAYFTYHEGRVSGVRMKAIVPGETTSPTSLSAASAQALAGAGLKKPREQCGDHLRRREEAEAGKVLVWPLVGDTKAARVPPNVRDEDLRKAEAYLLGKKRA